MKTDLTRFSVKKIIDQFEDKPKNTFMTIKVDHFAMDFKANILQDKIEQFNEDPSGMVGKPYTDYEFALMLDQVVNKYDYVVEDFLAIKWAVDS